jgi:methenyltetrahydromethanopterin cyclohydrolase
MFSISQEAVRIVKEKILPYAEQLNCQVIHLKNGGTVIDMGVNARGGWQAGKLFVEATIGGLGHVDFGLYTFGENKLPSIDVYIDHPVEATFSSQFSGWEIPGSDPETRITPIGSGPARAIARNDIWTQSWPYQDIHHETVFAVQTTVLPDGSLAQEVAQACHIQPENVYILAARTASLAGSIQVCSRTVEASIGKLFTLGFDLSKIISGMGTCPIAPPARNEFIGMDRTNTALIYGGMVRYVFDCRDEEIERILEKLPFSASRRFGESFADLMEEANRVFPDIDRDIHTVAVYEITNYATGRVFKAGKIHEDLLKRSLLPDRIHP